MLLAQGLDMFFPLFNHVLTTLFAAASVVEESSRQYVLMFASLEEPKKSLAQSLINLTMPV